MPRLYRPIAIIFFICLLVKADAQLLTYKNISTEEGLPSNVINIVIRDSKGYVWIGTKNGLCRWDSKNFEYFTIADGLPNNEVLYLYEDATGRIWISSFSRELCYFLNGKIYNRKNTPFLNKISSYPGSMLAELNNELYFSSADGMLNIFGISTQKNTVHHELGSLAPLRYISYRNKIWGIEDASRKDYFHIKNASMFIWSKDTSYYAPYYFLPNLFDKDIVTRIDAENKEYAFQHGLDAPFYKGNYTDKDFRAALYNNGKILEVYKGRIFQRSNNYLLKFNHTSRLNTFTIKNNLFIGTNTGLAFCSQVPILEYEQNPAINNSSQFIFKYRNEVYFVNNEYQIIRLADQKRINQLKEDAANLYNLLAFKDRFI